MNEKEFERLLAWSARLADGESIDWERVRGELEPELIARLTSLDALFATMRSVGGNPAGPEGELDSWGHLRIVAPLARGGFGVVYRAFDPILQREVALKLRRPDAAGGDTAWTREARRLARVRHPNVLAVHGAGVHESIPGLWSDLIEGETLRDRVAPAPVPRAELLSLARQLAAAVAAVHASGIVHGDIKPGNVMVEGGGRVVLMDFGAGQESSAARPRHTVVGSPLVMAPECLAGGRPSFASDVYALGAVLHYAATRRYPLEAERLSELEEKHTHGLQVDLSGTDTPRGFRRLVARMLDPEPGRRPEIGAVADDIERIRQVPARRRRIAAVTAIIALLVLGLTVTTVGYFRVRSAEAETAAVNEFLRRVLAAPRASELGREVRVVELLERAVPEAERRYVEQPMLLARIRELAGRTYVSLGEYATALPHLSAAREAYARQFGENDPRTVALLDPLARIAFATGEADAAGRTWRRMRELSEDARPGDRVNAITARIGLAELDQRGNRLDGAETTLREAIALGNVPGTETEALRARLLLADVLGRAGRLEEADRIASEALEQSLQLSGDRHANTVSARHNLVMIRYRQGDLESAESLARKNLAVTLDWLGNDPDRITITAQADLSNVLHMRGQLEESMALLESARAAARHAYPEGAVEPMSLSVNLVARYLDLGRYDEAVALARKNAENLDRWPEAKGQFGFVNGINLAEGLYRLGRDREALDQARSMQRAVADALGAGHPYGRVAEGFAGASLSRLGEPEEAKAVLDSAYQGLSQNLGAEHPLTLDVDALRAENLVRLERPEAALDLAQRTYPGLVAVYGAEHLKAVQLARLIERIEASIPAH